mgnify:CR=1 FL=1
MSDDDNDDNDDNNYSIEAGEVCDEEVWVQGHEHTYENDENMSTTVQQALASVAENNAKCMRRGGVGALLALLVLAAVVDVVTGTGSTLCL